AASSSTSSAVEPPDYLSEGELAVFNKIKAEFDPVNLEVQDISGGCGSMYALDIESARFKGLTVIKQHKLVNQVLADEIKSWHGVQLKTR
ncbi:bola-like protein, partial [Lophium mytilinum]